ncbi:tRNA pseudouridine(55) synthase TruB [Catenovulum adriaticum]|uniref:tRNA pseudouridine synthase B n=1 Tax=Catenovulum adriaticum TaxID=2984846 RepID=A0ABY7AMV5_9ALTE|nr:tRNA pseudouridine(55) synthase TruB [Catenovulum sp. TS8]WAJ70839.1 tRNA pseudouridine(55) synthase TruB [Catenovulum sp. TS8]
MNKKVKFRPLNGIILLDKAKGLSSNRVLQNIRFLYQAEKAGHTGALDPLATGLLPICFGEATKFSQYLLNADKTYQVTAKLGERTDTSDAEGEIVQTRSVNVTPEQITEQALKFKGCSEQQPSIYSALKYEGRPLYYYARKGIEVPRPVRQIEVYALTVDEIDLPYVTMTIACSKGTYIRTIVDDLGENLGCGAHVTELRRTHISGFDSEHMLTAAELEQLSADQRDNALLAVDAGIKHIPVLVLNEQQADKLRKGQKFAMPEQSAALYRAYTQADNTFLGVVEVLDHTKIVRTKRLLNTASALAEQKASRT